MIGWISTKTALPCPGLQLVFGFATVQERLFTGHHFGCVCFFLFGDIKRAIALFCTMATSYAGVVVDFTTLLVETFCARLTLQYLCVAGTHDP